MTTRARGRSSAIASLARSTTGSHGPTRSSRTWSPTPLSNATSGFLWGDYNGLTAEGDSFYGVFTGQSINRAKAEFDPIFFKESARP